MKKPKKTKLGLRVVMRPLLFVLLILLFIQGLFVLLVVAGTFGKIPDKPELRKIQNPIATEIYTADGILMGTYNIQNRQFLDPSDINESVRNALIATEDARFYRHEGIDIRSLFRVLFKTILLGKEGSGGGSTLTQQLAKNLYPREDRGLLSMPVNKVREMRIAMRMEKVYSKDEILELYLSSVPFGENTFGIKAASRRYFNKEPQYLKPEEAAVLVGMLKATRNYNPVIYPERALGRRNIVLAQMARYDYLEPSAADSLQGLDLEVDYHPLPHNAGIAPYFREYLRAELNNWCKEHYKNEPGVQNETRRNQHKTRRNQNGSGYIQAGEPEPYNLYTDGLKVYTTIDSRLQQYAEEAMKSHMNHLQQILEKQWQGKDLWKGVSEEQLLFNYDGKHRPGMASEPKRKMEVFTWEGKQEKAYNTLDSIRHYLEFLQAGILSMDVRTGEIKAWVGGINHEYFKYDHVRSRRQAGSTFKPLVYLEALEQGISPCEYFPNDSIVYHDYEDWVPRNADRSYGGFYSLRGALVHSVNTVSVDLLMQIGIDSVLELCQKAGIKSDLPAVPSLALGSGEISLLEMVAAYQAIANHGLAKDPLYLIRIEDRNGAVLQEWGPSRDEIPICRQENADLMVGMLREVVSRGTAVGLGNKYNIRADVAGKTGTTQNYTDGWFIGFTPGLVSGVWVGGDLQNVRFRNMHYGQGASSAMPIWADYMNKVFQDESWAFLGKEHFQLDTLKLSQLDCDDFVEKKPSKFQPIKTLKEKRIFRRLFRRNR